MKHKRQQIDAENLQLAALYGPLIQQQAAAVNMLRNSATVASSAFLAHPGNVDPGTLMNNNFFQHFQLPASPATAAPPYPYNISSFEGVVGLSRLFGNNPNVPVTGGGANSIVYGANPGNLSSLGADSLKLSSAIHQPMVSPSQIKVTSQATLMPVVQTSLSPHSHVSMYSSTPGLDVSTNVTFGLSRLPGAMGPPLTTMSPNPVPSLSSLKPPHILTEKLHNLVRCVTQTEK